jgi:ornithine carbamoyltransferase
MRRKPSNEDLLTAAEWLDVNEGDSGEKEACHATAEWLRDLVEKLDRQAAETNAVKKIAKEAGVPLAKAREALRAFKKI